MDTPSTESLLGGAQADTAATGGTADEVTAQPVANTSGEATPAKTEGEATKAEGDGQANEGDKGTKEGDKPTGAPEKYEAFKVPEGYTLDAALVGEFEPVLRELNLSQEDAQKVFDFAPKYAEFVSKQTAAAVLDQLGIADRAAWVGQTKGDKEIGGDALPENLAVAKKALDKFATPQLRDVLLKTGLTNHPEMVRAWARVGKAISDDSYVPGGKTKTPAPFYEKSHMNP